MTHRNRYKTLRWLTLAVMTSCAPLVSHAADWIYRVRLHDNIWDLSTRYMKSGIPAQKLQDYNKVVDPYHLPPGMNVRIPIAWLRVQPAKATVVAVIGDAHVELPGKLRAEEVQADMQLDFGTHLITDHGASLTLQFADGSRVLMQQDSELDLDRMTAYGRTGMVDTRLRLQRGRVSDSVTPMTGTAAHFSVETPGTISSVRGTHFRVAADAQGSRTEVLTGRVQVAADHRSALVSKGFGVATGDSQSPGAVQSLLAAPALTCPTQPVAQLPYQMIWQALAGARHYRVQIAANDRFEALLLDRLVDGNNVELPDLPDGHYALRVHGSDDSGLEGEDASCGFAISGHPQPPLVIDPQPDGKVRSPRPRFRWTESDQVPSYVWQLSGDATFSTLLESQNAITGDSIRASHALSFGRYYWRIASRDRSGKQGPFTQAMLFEVVPELPAPAVGKTTSKRHRMSFSWQPGSPGQRYHIQVARDPTFIHPAVDQTVDQATLDTAKLAHGKWYVRVQTIDTDGYAGPWGPVQLTRQPCLACRIGMVGGGAALLWLLL